MKSQSNITKLGWALALTLTALAFMPWMHWWVGVARLVVLAALMVYVWRVNTRERIDKALVLTVEGVSPDAVPHFQEVIDAALGDDATLMARTHDEPVLRFSVRTDRTLASIARRLKKAGLPMGLLELEAGLNYTVTDSSAQLSVEVHGQASPHSQVFLAGVDEPVSADARGRFRVRLPFSVVRAHESRGYVPGMWRKDRVQEEIRVPIPA